MTEPITEPVTEPVRLTAVGTALPGDPVDNATLARLLNLSRLWADWIESFVGTRTRHLAMDLSTGEVRYRLADLGTTAGSRALAAAGLGPDDVDLVVLGTATPDALLPATVNQIADRLGIDGVATFQLQSGCSGAVQALEVATRLLSTGCHRTALVLGGDVSAKHADPAGDAAALPPSQLINIALFGDGAGAAVLTTDPAHTPPAAPELREVYTRLVGLGREPGQCLDWYGPFSRPEGSAVNEDYKAIEERVPEMAVEILGDLLAATGWEPADVDYLLPPQLSGRMTTLITERLDLKAEEVSCVAETGNNGNALVFFQLERLLPRLAAGRRALGIAVESSKWIKAGFALQG